MNTNNSVEYELDLKWLLFRILRAWRSIVLVALVVGVLVFAYSIISGFMELADPEYIAEAERNYNTEHAAWVATGENYVAKIENIMEKQAEQKEYNEKSVLMQIDPLREFNGSLEIYVDYDYKIMPDKSYQNSDLSDRILKAYATYMTNGDLYQYIMENTNYDLERRYLKEILTTNVDYNNNMISFAVKQQSEELCAELLGLLEMALNMKHGNVNDTIAEHKLAVINSAVYETVNLTLQETQKENRQAISDLDIALQETYEGYLDWRLKPEPQPEYTRAEVVKSAIKALILGCVIGGFLMVFVEVVKVLMSGKLNNSQDVEACYGVRLLGELPKERVKKPFACVSNWFCKLGGITRTPENFDAIAQVVSANIKADINARENASDWKKIAFAGTVSEAEIAKLAEATGLKDAYTLVNAPELLTTPASVEALSDVDCVVLVEKQEVSVRADIGREIEMLNAWNKDVLGIVVLNADAVM